MDFYGQVWTNCEKSMKLEKYYKIVGIIHKTDKTYQIPKLVLENVSDDLEYKDMVTDISDHILKKYYSGERPLSPDKVYMICKHFDISKLSNIFKNVNRNTIVAIVDKLKNDVRINETKFDEEMAQLFLNTVVDNAIKESDDNIKYSRHFDKLQKELLSKTISRIENSKNGKANIKIVATNINSKIYKENKELLKRIKDNAILNYKIINQEMKKFERTNKVSSDSIREIIRYQYTIYANKTKDQEKIFDSMIIWLNKETNCSLIIATKIISYFVHTCEVFDVIAK